MDRCANEYNATRVNTKHQGRFKPLVKLLKFWNSNLPTTVRAKSFMIETMAVRLFDVIDLPSLETAAIYFLDFVGSRYGEPRKFSWESDYGMSFGLFGVTVPDFAGTGSNTAGAFDSSRGRALANKASRAAPTMVLSHALWQRRFGGDPSVVGSTIRVSDGQRTIVGVMPPGFRTMMPPDSNIPDDLQAWLPLESSWFGEAPRGQRFLRVVARMRPDVTFAQAEGEIARVGTEIGREHVFYGERGLRLTSVPLHAEAVRDVTPTVLMLFGGVALLLVIACVNVASLFVARAATRQHETAVRLALGAGPGRVFRLHAAEGLLLATLGGLAGIWIAQVCLKLLLALRPSTLSRLDAAQIDATVLAFAAGVTLTWGLLLSLAPTAELWRTNVSGVLNGVGRAGGTGLPYRRRAALVVCQLALSVVLLVSAALLVRGFAQLVNSDPGFSAQNVVTFRLPNPKPEVLDSFGGSEPFLEELRSRLGALPGVTHVGAISHLPYDEGLPNWATPYLREGDTDRDNAGTADTRAVLPGYFETVGARLLEGRFFTDADVPEAPTVAIVDERLAQRMWPGESAAGAAQPDGVRGPRHGPARRAGAASAASDDGVGPAAGVVRRSGVHGVRRGRALGAAVRDGARGRVRDRGAAVDGPRRVRRDGVWRRRAAARARRSSGARREPSGGREIGDRRSRAAARGGVGARARGRRSRRVLVSRAALWRLGGRSDRVRSRAAHGDGGRGARGVAARAPRGRA
jgi:hypothetical protein